MFLTCCSAHEQNDDDLTVQDADAVTQADYGSSVIGWYIVIGFPSPAVFTFYWIATGWASGL